MEITIPEKRVTILRNFRGKYTVLIGGDYLGPGYPFLRIKYALTGDYENGAVKFWTAKGAALAASRYLSDEQQLTLTKALNSFKRTH